MEKLKTNVLDLFGKISFAIKNYIQIADFSIKNGNFL